MPVVALSDNRLEKGGLVARILVIEDDESFLDLLRLHLSLAGHSVQGAEDPELGLRSVLESPPDLIVLDIDLPFLSGIEVLEALRSDPGYRKIPVIVVTGHRDDEIYARCLKIGVDGFFTKPVQSDQLIEAVGKSLATPSKS